MNLYFLLLSSVSLTSSCFKKELIENIQRKIKNEIVEDNLISFDDHKTIYMHTITFSNNNLRICTEIVFYEQIKDKFSKSIHIPDPSSVTLNEINGWIADTLRILKLNALHIFFYDLHSLSSLISKDILVYSKTMYEYNLIYHMNLNKIYNIKIWNRRCEHQIGFYTPYVIYNEFINRRYQLVYKFKYRNRRYLMNLNLSERTTTEYLKLFRKFYFRNYFIRDPKVKEFIENNLVNLKILVHDLEVSLYLYCISNPTDMFKIENYDLKPIESYFESSEGCRDTEDCNVFITTDITFEEHKDTFLSFKKLKELIILFNLIRGTKYFKKIILNSLINYYPQRYYVFMSILIEIGSIDLSYYRYHTNLSTTFDFPIISSINEFLVDDIVDNLVDVTSASKIKKYKHLLIYLYLYFLKNSNLNVEELLEVIGKIFLCDEYKNEHWITIGNINFLFHQVLRPTKKFYIVSSLLYYKKFYFTKGYKKLDVKSLNNIMDELKVNKKV